MCARSRARSLRSQSASRRYRGDRAQQLEITADDRSRRFVDESRGLVADYEPHGVLTNESWTGVEDFELEWLLVLPVDGHDAGDVAQVFFTGGRRVGDWTNALQCQSTLGARVEPADEPRGFLRC